MTLQEINFIAQTIAAFAVVGSLIYLAIQTRHNTRVMRATAAFVAEIEGMDAEPGPTFLGIGPMPGAKAK